MHLIHLIAASLSFFLIYVFAPVDSNVAAGLAILVAIAWLWLSEALHISVTALLVPLLAIATGIFSPTKALSHFADPIIFLFLGGFALAAGLRQQGLDRWMASWVLQKAGGELGKAARWLFYLTAFLSMWISNTATAAMMLPLALGLLAPLDFKSHRSTWAYLLLGVAFSANIGGIGTLVGSPPNAIAAAAVNLSFAQWMLWGVPLVLVLMPAMETTLRYFLKPAVQVQVPQVQATAIQWKGKPMGMLLVFALAVVLWMFGKPISNWIQVTQGYDALVAVFALILLNLFRLAHWSEIEKSADWGVLLLFGGGITLSAALSSSGAAAWMAEWLGIGFANLSPLLILALILVFTLILTEVASNTASASLLIPIFMGISPEVSSVAVAVMVAVATSCAFLLPVATPPNAIIFGSGQVTQRQMLRHGAQVTLVVFPLLILAAALLLGWA